METIVYRGNQIHVFNDGTILAYVLNTDGDIEEVSCSSIENAMQRIDAHNQYMEGEQ
jgi:adenine deaminase